MKKRKLEELGRLDIGGYQEAKKIPLIVVLDNLRSAYNVGSFFRTCDCFRVQKLYMTGISSYPPNREIHKTAIGATMTVDWEYRESIVSLTESLKKDGYTIVGIEQTTESVALTDYKVGEKTALVFGNEVEGLSEEILPLLHGAVEIPQYGTKHSLNVSVCGGIVIHKAAQDLLPKIA